MTTYVITVPKIARYMSANDRPNRWVKAAQTKAWRQAAFDASLDVVELMARQHASTRLTLAKPVRITATVHIKDNRRREVSNLFPTFKACIDGFVDAGILADDSDAHVIGPDPRRGYDPEPRIVFTLEEVA
jgi:crossover junction endodeoxyribonuclease RusA